MIECLVHNSIESLERKDKIIINQSVIKGYHQFKIKPLHSCNFSLPVEREYTNITDTHACLVWIPEKVPENKLNLVTDEKRYLTLKDIVGLPCGHVRRGLAPAFRIILDKGGQIMAEATQEPRPSFPPWPEQLESGGGIVIPFCIMVFGSKDKLWQMDTSNTGKVKLDEGFLELQTQSASLCAAKCTSIDICRSFYYSDITQTCIGHDRVPGIDEMTTDTDEYRMFYGVDRPDFCSNDFTFEAKVDMCYKIYELADSKTADDARSFCEGLSGHLVRIDTQERYDVIINDPNFDTVLPIPYYIDGFLSTGTDWFTYSNGRNVSLPYDQSLWMVHEPTKGPGDMCLSIYPSGPPFQWIDYGCSSSAYRFICELSLT
ncbi:hypothetical protein FSP39_003759 [Pinctada imbricata]|uniref:C-type lectin domain-containing protein n=1 Tax=Pinctada imbricata TaxID=66713 RepID=A0AA89BNH3_PINIB|nr:hypothetical protein FSP39_003759 [Pinctada imbricata]